MWGISEILEHEMRKEGKDDLVCNAGTGGRDIGHGHAYMLNEGG